MLVAHPACNRFLCPVATPCRIVMAAVVGQRESERERERERETDCRTNVHGADGAIHAHLAMWHAYRISIAFLFVDRAMQKQLF